MLKCLAFLLGFSVVVAHVPIWGQPSIEPKSALLLASGALAWGWLAWKGRLMTRYPWALLLPVGWLLVSASWSPAPFLGLQRLIWFLAACGVGTLLADDDPFYRFMHGFLAGTGIHAVVILLQWVPSIRAVMPVSLGSDPFQGVGRGLFHNTNMAAVPFVILVGWLLLSKKQKPWSGHLVWVLPALSLTQSRLGIGVSAGILAYWFLGDSLTLRASERNWFKTIFKLLLVIAWSLTAHRWAWLLPAGGIIIVLYRRFESIESPSRRHRYFRALPVLGLSLAVLAGLATPPSKNATQTLVQGTLIQGDVSQSQRLSYYRVAALALLDSPLSGQGLGSARQVYPRFVDRNRPAAEIAYGDFQRPNNFHSELLEMLAEGGLPLVLLLLLGFWLDRQNPVRRPRALLLVPLALIALLDFPFHNPLGLLWVGITLGFPGQSGPEDQGSISTRLLSGLLGFSLLVLAGLQIHTAQARPDIERRYLAKQDALGTLALARSLWKSYPFSADYFDLFSKSAIQALPSNPNPAAVQDLDQLLKYDPYDHHLLLARAQIARRAGDGFTAQAMIARYLEVAPLDPERYLRLARDAFQQGKPTAAIQLIEEAKRQPGFNAIQQRRIESMLGQHHSDSR